MKIAQKDLLECLQTAMRAYHKGATIPILRGIFMHAEEGILEVSCTNLDYWARCKATCEGDLSVVVDAGVLLEIVKRLKGDIELENAATLLKVRCETTRYELNTMPEDEFPLFPILEEQTFEIPSDAFRLLASVAYAVEDEKGPRPNLHGVLLASHENGMRAVATDTFRLAMADVDTTVEFAVGVIVPPRILRDASKLAGMIECGVTPQLLRMSCGNVTYVTRLLDGQFPNYQRIISDECQAKVVVERKALQDALGRMAALKRDKGDTVTLTLTADGLGISTKSEDIGRAEETVSADVEGTVSPISLRRVYLQEALDAIDDSKVTMLLASEKNPVNLIGTQSRHLIMPVMVRG